MLCGDGDDGCGLGTMKDACVEKSSEDLAEKMECRLRHQGPAESEPDTSSQLV